jgi:lauroyl/myristoyl acyltransferase
LTDEARTPDSGVRYSPHRRVRSEGLRHVARRTRERGVIGGYRAAEAALGLISPRISAPVGRALFLGGYYGWAQKRRIVLANASHVLGLPVGDPAVAQLARRIYASYSQFAIDLMRLPSRPVDEPLHLMKSEPGRGMDSFVELWQRYSSQGRGIIAVSGHIGSIEVFAAASGLRGIPTYGLADDSEYPELFARLTEMRQRRGIGVIPWRNLREVYKALRKPAVLGLVVDWGYRPDDIPVRLFNAWTTLPAGPATLAARTGAMILPVVNRRLPDGNYVASHADPIEVPGSSAAEILRTTQAIAEALEAQVRESPEQWFTFKPMWPSTAGESRALELRAARMAGE